MTIIQMIFSVLFALFLAYFLYTRFVSVYMRIWFYSKQGIPFARSGILPVLGSLKAMMDFVTRTKYEGLPIIGWNHDTYIKGKEDKVPAISGLMMGYKVCLIVNRPEVAEDMLLTKGKYFDKHPFSSNWLSISVGNSIVFAKSDLEWQEKRKILSAALYKDRLRAMIDSIKMVTVATIEEDWKH